MTETLPLIKKKTIDGKQGAIRAIRFNVDGNYAISCGSDKTLKLWNPLTGTLLKSYIGHGFEVLDACGSCDNSMLASGSMDKSLFIWDVESGKALRRIRGHAGRINAVAFNEDSTLVFSASLDGTVKAWDCRSRKTDPVQTLDEATDSVTSVAVTDHEIMTGSADKTVRRYDLREGQMYTDFVGSSVTSVNFSRDGQCALMSTLDNTVRLLDKSNGQMLAEFTGHKNEDYKIDSNLLSTDAQVVSGSEDGKVYVWDLIQGKVLATLPHKPGQTVHSICPHPTKQRLLTAQGSSFNTWMPEREEEDEDGDDENEGGN